MTKFNLALAGAGALALALGASSAALAKPDYLDRMTPRPAKPAAQIASCDCPMMQADGSPAAVCMSPPGPAP